MRPELDRDRLHRLMREIARRAPGHGPYRVYLVGGGTAVWMGWRRSTIDADLYSDQEAVFEQIQTIKERVQVNVEFARPEQFVPPLEGSDARHVHIETIGPVAFFHYDPYSQCLSKIVRGFRKDVLDARDLIASGLVDPQRFRSLVQGIPTTAYSRYPALTPRAVSDAVDAFLPRARPGNPPE